MSTSYELGAFVFESRETYDLAKKEWDVIAQLEEKADLSQPKVALKVYNKLVTEKTFTTIIGYSFLRDLRQYLLDNNVGTADSLAEIPIKEKKGATRDIMPTRPNAESRFKRLYDLEIQTNKKLKIALVAAVFMLLGFVIITMSTDYSVFTYFTNYKANMEEELIDKYEAWEEELEQRENALKTGEDSVQGLQ